jgi:hypothetical protein
LPDEPVVLAAHDQRWLRDQRQALFDPVGERRSSSRQERTDSEAGVVASRARKQRPRFPRCITQPAE